VKSKLTQFGICMLLALNAHAQRLISYVDPFIGTGGHGHTFPGATVPFGMVQLSPDNGRSAWDWCSGYFYADSVIAGFSHMHLSGTGIGDWEDISVMPENRVITDTADLGRTTFSHRNEKASPGFYEVKMNNGITAKLSAAEHCGFHDYTYPASVSPVIKLDLGYHEDWDRPTSTYIKQLNDSTLAGYRYSTGWAQTQRVYFVLRSSVPFKKLYLTVDGKPVSADEVKGVMVVGQLLFKEKTNNNIKLKVALSTVSSAKALIALNEIQGWDINRVKAAAEAKWEHELSKMQIKTNDLRLKRIF